MSDPFFVPSTLLDPLDRAIAGPELERRVVTAFVLAGGGTPKQWATGPNLKRARDVWPANWARRPARNVLTILLELEQLGVVSDLEHVAGGFSVRGKGQAA